MSEVDVDCMISSWADFKRLVELCMSTGLIFFSTIRSWSESTNNDRLLINKLSFYQNNVP